MSGGAHHSSHSVQMQGSFPSHEQAHGCLPGWSRVCARGGRAGGGTLQSCPAVLVLLQTWAGANALSLPVERGDFFFLLCFDLGFLRGPLRLGSSLLRISRLWLSLQRQEAALHWGKQLVANSRTKAIFIPFMFSRLSPPGKISLCPWYHTIGDLQGGLEFAISRSMFLLNSQLLPVPVHCLLCPELDGLGCRFCALCRIAFISISSCSSYFSKHEFISRDLRFISIVCPASERMRGRKYLSGPICFQINILMRVCVILSLPDFSLIPFPRTNRCPLARNWCVAVNRQCFYYPVNLHLLSDIHRTADAPLLVCLFTGRNFILVSGLW